MYYFIGYGFANDGSDAGFIGTKYFVPRSHLYKDGYNISLKNWFAQVLSARFQLFLLASAIVYKDSSSLTTSYVPGRLVWLDS